MLEINSSHIGHAGELISTPYETDKIQHRELLQCCHCGFTTVKQPGSGRAWGFCARCNGLFCGWNEGCHLCVPSELLIENMEAGLPFEEARRHRPIRISTAGLLLPGG